MTDIIIMVVTCSALQGRKYCGQVGTHTKKELDIFFEETEVTTPFHASINYGACYMMVFPILQ